MKNKLILFYCYFEDTTIRIKSEPLKMRVLVKASTPKEAKEISEDHMKEYHPGYKFSECATPAKGPIILEVSNMIGTGYSDGMIGPL